MLFFDPDLGAGLRLPFLSPEPVGGALYADPPEPEAKMVLALRPFVAAMQIEKDILRYLFRSAGIAREPQRDREDHALVRFNDAAKLVRSHAHSAAPLPIRRDGETRMQNVGKRSTRA